MNTSNQLKAGALLSYVNMAISTVIPFLYTPIMLEVLGQAEYGLYSLSNSVISYLSLLTLGLGSTIHRYYMQALTAKDHDRLGRITGLFVVIYSVIAVITVASGFLLTNFTGTLFAKGLTASEMEKLNILIVIMTGSTGVSLLAVPFSSVIVCHERYVFLKLLSIVGTIVAPVANLAVLYAGYASVGMACAGMALQIMILFAYVWYSCRCIHVVPRFVNLPIDLLKEIFGFTFYVFIASIADLLYWSTDKVLIGAMIGSKAVAVYNIGVTFNSMLQQLSSAISSVFGPRVNHLVFSGRPTSEISELMIRVGRIQYLVIALVLAGFITFGRAFLLLWVGPEYDEAYDVALFTMLPMAIPLIQNLAFNTIVAMNKHQFRSILYVILAVANVVATYLLLPVMGIIGAALCTCVVFVLGNGFIINWYYKCRIGLDIIGFWKNIIRMTLVPVALTVVGVFLENTVLPIRTPAHLMCGVTVFTCAYFVMSWLFSMNPYEKGLVCSMVNKLLRRHG